MQHSFLCYCHILRADSSETWILSAIPCDPNETPYMWCVARFCSSLFDAAVFRASRLMQAERSILKTMVVFESFDCFFVSFCEFSE